MRCFTALAVAVCAQFVLMSATQQSLARGTGKHGGCTPSTGPDVIVGDLVGWLRFNPVGGIGAWTFGTTSCNLGNEVLPWIAASNQHPVIAMNAYRLKNGRFEQIGMSWVKHGWGASAENVCCQCINPQNFEALGVGCSDPYDANTNAIQGGFFNNGNIVAGLGPRSDINPFTGAFTWPYTTHNMNGNSIYKRLQIALTDVDPALNAGALYFAESQYVTPNEAAIGNHYNNVSYRRFLVGAPNGGSWTLSFSGAPATQRQKPAIQAWKDNDPAVTIQALDVPDDGRFFLAHKVSNNGNGTWHYEYALWNMHSDRAAKSFSVPVPLGVTRSNIGFHDVFYHSGEHYDGADWAPMTAPVQDFIGWTTEDFAVNINANALRWGTLYNFRFDADTKPRNVTASVGLFKPGTPTVLTISTEGPSRRGDTNGDNSVNIDDLVSVITGWGACPAAPAPCPGDLNGDGQVNIDDLVGVITNWG